VRVLLSALFWLYCGVSLTVWWFAVLVPWLVVTPFDRRRRFSHWYAYTWANHFHAISPFWDIVLRNEDRARPDRAYVMVANHESSADILLIYRLKRQYRWVSKRANFFVPFLGWMMWMAGYVPVRRGDRASREAMMVECERQLSMGNSIMMFPEGTRSGSVEMLRFKRGAFSIACRAGVPVLPIVIAGTREILPRNSLVFTTTGKTRPRIEVLDPVHPDEVDGDAAALAKLVRGRMVEARERLRHELAAERPVPLLGRLRAAGR
jgi:1-acyl-sn-glycerol-3-phosphate acyltransferase